VSKYITPSSQSIKLGTARLDDLGDLTKNRAQKKIPEVVVAFVLLFAFCCLLFVEHGGERTAGLDVVSSRPILCHCCS
jgi:hypothetical protein